MQIHDFLREYETKSDEELLRVARDIDDLTLEARAALQSELSRRGLKTSPTETIEEKAAILIPEVAADPSTSTNQFLLRVTRTYRQHFWLFIRLIAPATVISFYLVLSVRERAVAALLRAYEFEGRSWGVLRTEAMLIADATFFTSWMLFCIAYAGIASAVVRLSSGESPTIRSCFAELRERKWIFFKASLLLFVILGSAIILRNAVLGGLFVLFTHQMLGPAGRMLEFAVTFIILIAFSRLALVIPLVLNEEYGVRDALFRSDEMTEKKWTTLSALIANRSSAVTSLANYHSG
jgi:hypothetical protein